MAIFLLYPWVQFLTGLVAGCWLGVVIGCGVTLLLMGRRIRHMETVNVLLRSKLKVREKARKTGTGGPPLVMPMPGATRPAGTAAQGRVASRH